MNAALYLLTGPWASGKTTAIPQLRQLLPEAVVFDWDILLPGLSLAIDADASTEPLAWPGLHEMWVAILESVLASGCDVLLCGPATPAEFSDGRLARYPIRCAYLDCPNDLLAMRLRARGVVEHEIADELAFLSKLRDGAHTAIFVHQQTPHQIAKNVAAWVETSRQLKIEK